MARISANKLGEFLVTSNPVRRRRIISDQKNPNGAAVPRYRLAMDPIDTYLQSGGVEANAVLTVIDQLRNQEGGSDWVLDDRKNTAEALDCFLDLSSRLPLDDVEYLRGDTDPPKLSISGVDVSVRPDFLIFFQRRGVQCVGAVKFHFIKSEESALEQRGSEYVATLLQRWLNIHGPRNKRPMHTHCFSVDVFRGTIVAAPGSFVRRMAEMEAACEEIAARWPSI